MVDVRQRSKPHARVDPLTYNTFARSRCLCRLPAVAVVQTAEYWKRHDFAAVREVLRRAGDRLLDVLMESGVVEVADIFLDSLV